MESKENEKEDSNSEYLDRQEEKLDNSDVAFSNNNSSTKTQETSDDPMLGFLTLLAKVERPSCANCELKDVSPMFYCNTCGKSRIQNHILVSAGKSFLLNFQ